MERKSIKECNTTGLSYFERKYIARQHDPIPIGDTVYDAGDFADPVSKITVTEDNQFMISMFWNSSYFDNYKAASRKNAEFHNEYADYQARALEACSYLHRVK